MTDQDYGGGSVVSGSPSKSKSILLSLFNTNGPKVLLSRHQYYISKRRRIVKSIPD